MPHVPPRQQQDYVKYAGVRNLSWNVAQVKTNPRTTYIIFYNDNTIQLLIMVQKMHKVK